ncbi:HAD domain-containing protein [Streptomyces sp. NPDC048111]|uniref:HAD domain-containing protein n=1 Tax=Streptomyces sp. NPDC048111 TaxID=3365500 RepID=UPI00371CD87B
MTASSPAPAPAARPLLFLDVDGPLIPFGRPEGYPTYEDDRGLRAPSTNPLLARLNPAYGPRFTALARDCDLVWATTWMEEANECVAPRLGLPQLPVVHWPDESSEPGSESDLARADARRGLHWKTRVLLAYAAGRPFAWLDDEIRAVDRHWVADHSPAPALLHQVNPREGLVEMDFAVVAAWLRGAGR